jgi:hypothetical protein
MNGGTKCCEAIHHHPHDKGLSRAKYYDRRTVPQRGEATSRH